MAFMDPCAPKYRQRRQSTIRKTLDVIGEDPMVANILNIYDQCTADEFNAGVGWYPVAHELAVDLGVGARSGAGVFAALSPQLSWTSNITAAQNLVQNDDPNPAGIGKFVGRARDIRDGADPDIILGGRKVRSFYRNIFEPSRPGPVTIDRHAVAIATNHDVKSLEKNGFYVMVAAAYRGAARLAGLLPSEMQACTWLTWRRLLNDEGFRGHQFRV